MPGFEKDPRFEVEREIIKSMTAKEDSQRIDLKTVLEIRKSGCFCCVSGLALRVVGSKEL